MSALLGIVFLSACQSSGEGGPDLSLAEIKTPTPSISENGPSTSTSVQKLTYKVGPFVLPAGQKAQVMWDAPGSITFKTEEPLWVTSFESSIEDSSGGELPSSLLHLAVLTNASEKNALCTDKEVANPFVAATSITKNIDMPDGAGYPVLSEDQIDAKVVLQNPTSHDFSGVYFKFEITAVPMKAAKNIKDVMPMLLNVDPCDYSPMAVAPKEFVKKEVRFIVPENGLLTKAYGLLQDYGVGVALLEKGQPAPFWEGKAELTGDHKIVSIPVFEDPAGVPLKAGDEISMQVAYDNQAERWQDGAIGAVMAYITRTDDDKEPSSSKSTDVVSTISAQKMLLK